MSGINKSLKNAMLTSGGLLPVTPNYPAQYSGKQHEYFNDESKTFTQMYAQYASDFVSARVQGLDPNNPLAWQTRLLRMADVVHPSAAILRRADNYKMVLFADKDIQYLRLGTKIEAMGSTWLVTNPFNISGSSGSGIVQRCNAIWNYLDYYGNVKSEPMVVSNPRADANDSDAQEANLITKGYFNVTMQRNDVTAQIDTNTRFILGTAAYRVTGYSDFQQEFTGDYDSVRLLEYTVRYEEPNKEIDDMENHVAGGKSFSWRTTISGSASLSVGQTAQYESSSIRNGESVEDTEEYPISYIWSSSNESVAVVDASGVVTAVSEGNTSITASIAQNSAQTASILVKVEAESAGNGVRFTAPVPATLSAYDDCELNAAYYENGVETQEPLTWQFDGADSNAYTVVTGNKAATVYCFGYSEKNLRVWVKKGNYSAIAEIKLLGI